MGKLDLTDSATVERKCGQERHLTASPRPIKGRDHRVGESWSDGSPAKPEAGDDAGITHAYGIIRSAMGSESSVYRVDITVRPSLISSMANRPRMQIVTNATRV